MGTEWKDLSAEERYRVVELARSGKTEITEICATFGVARQTLYKAMDAAEQGAMAALEPKKPGRKPKPEEQLRALEWEQEKTRLEKALEHMRQRYEVAKTILDMERKITRGESLPGETEGGKKRRLRRRRKP
ncbi:MAG: helix-turn-helix domain-containing protein [Deltaproteobacteria bacterium]|nr:helix-turn-helix domain-containing protein [Deltaproteobacteria bacterium]